MNLTPKLSSNLITVLQTSFGQYLDRSDLERLIPAHDSVRVWWQFAKDTSSFRHLVEVLTGSSDFLTLAALIQAARAKGCRFSTDLEKELAEILALTAERRRNEAPPPGAWHAFVSYCHRDRERVDALLTLLADAGLRVYRDVEEISPGASITATLHKAMSTCNKALLLVTANYLQSEWARLERSYLCARRDEGNVALMPILLEDVSLPKEIRDTFTIDLRGFRGKQDRDWAAKRLRRLVSACQV